MVRVLRKPTAAQVVLAMKATGLPMHTVWAVYGAMLEAVDQDGSGADGGAPIAPPGPDIGEVARVTSERCRRARALMDWSKLDLAWASGVNAVL
ncbi:hypothetical protein [Azospirillum canadense]|uniref:hypothetical protein n=1 Tax=Azospirillum canadense TaxID=403962 RepID=UPI00222696C4|nr:hypothetical protein [Azospirillum canadense]MCW2242508.1 hypothetical protein [Azospirillum canadense]